MLLNLFFHFNCIGIMKEEKFIDSAGFLLMFTESLSQIILDKLQPQDRERVQAVINFRLSLDSETDRGCDLVK